MYINYTGNYRPFYAMWDVITDRANNCVWMVPGTFDCDGNSTIHIEDF